MLVNLGQLVSSKAGRDQGNYFLVVAKLNDRFVQVADGRLRKVENPKKKNLQHLIVHPDVAKDIEIKLQEQKPITNREVREALLSLGVTE